MATLPIRCPRCADRVDLELRSVPRLTFQGSPFGALLTADVRPVGVRHVCVDDTQDGSR